MRACFVRCSAGVSHGSDAEGLPELPQLGPEGRSPTDPTDAYVEGLGFHLAVLSGPGCCRMRTVEVQGNQL